MASVAIHPPKTPVTKGSTGIAKATTPNMCKMPGPPAPFVPSPLPNIAKSGSSPKGYSKSVKIEGNAVAIFGATFKSVGDMASKGTGGGMISANTHGPAKFITPGSPTVTIEGKSVHLLGEPMLNNCGPSGAPPNTGATLSGVDQAESSNNDVVIEMDCGGYPEDDVPYFKMESNPERWRVRPTQNGKSTRAAAHSDTAALEEAFQRRVDLGLTSGEQGILGTALRIGGAAGSAAIGTGQQAVAAIRQVNSAVLSGMAPGYKFNYHHLRPTWAGGGNAPSNIWPARPGHATAGVHQWWNGKLQESMTDSQKSLLTGKTPPPTVNTISENNIGKMAEKCRNMDPPRDLVIEMNCPEATEAI